MFADVHKCEQFGLERFSGGFGFLNCWNFRDRRSLPSAFHIETCRKCRSIFLFLLCCLIECCFYIEISDLRIYQHTLSLDNGSGYYYGRIGALRCVDIAQYFWTQK